MLPGLLACQHGRRYAILAACQRGTNMRKTLTAVLLAVALTMTTVPAGSLGAEPRETVPTEFAQDAEPLSLRNWGYWGRSCKTWWFPLWKRTCFKKKVGRTMTGADMRRYRQIGLFRARTVICAGPKNAVDKPPPERKPWCWTPAGS